MVGHPNITLIKLSLKNLLKALEEKKAKKKEKAAKPKRRTK